MAISQYSNLNPTCGYDVSRKSSKSIKLLLCANNQLLIKVLAFDMHEQPDFR